MGDCLVCSRRVVFYSRIYNKMDLLHNKKEIVRAQYIDKDALVAEIEKRKNFNETLNAHSRLDECNAILSLIDTLEVKEVNLNEYYHDFLQKEWFDKTCNRTMSEMMAFTAKHFFELGLKAQKGEKV